MRALITGVTGQDGSYLAEHLADVGGWDVVGLVRGQRVERQEWLAELVPALRFVAGDLTDAGSLHRALAEHQPEVVFHLGAQSAPGVGWSQPVLTADVTGLGTLRLLDAVTATTPDAAVVVAGSLATHGPYGAAKLFTRAVCDDYRRRGLRVSVAVFGGHHSPRRGPEFLSRKVTRAVARIAAGRQQDLTLGSLSRRQDWGSAQEYAQLLPRLLDLPADDYVISTGIPYSAQEWVARAFAAAGLEWTDHVVTDPTLNQPTDVTVLSAPPDPRLRWLPQTSLDELIASMVHHDMRALV